VKLISKSKLIFLGRKNFFFFFRFDRYNNKKKKRKEMVKKAGVDEGKAKKGKGKTKNGKSKSAKPLAKQSKSKSSSKDGKKKKENASSSSSTQKERRVLVFDGAETHDWCKLFADSTLSDGSKIHVCQASWAQSRVVVDNTANRSNARVFVQPVRESHGKFVRPQSFCFTPDMVLVRNQPRGPSPESDRRANLYGLIAANVPAVNSLHSILCQLERPVMFGALKAIEMRLGHDKFPLISQTYYSHPDAMVCCDYMPAVAKISHAHAGQGKMLLESMQQFTDLRTVLNLHGDYSTVEKFVEVSHGIRVQRINTPRGPSYTVLKKMQTGGSWRSHFGGAHLSVIELTDEYKRWADEAAQLFGGLDLLALDVVVGKDGKHFIIELNGSAIGILADHWLAESEKIRDLVIERMNEIYCQSIDDEFESDQDDDDCDDSVEVESSPETRSHHRKKASKK
jgi:synapsin